MLIFFFDPEGVVHKEFIPSGQTINAARYVDILEILRKSVLRVRKVIAGTWVLHYNKAPSHTALFVREFLAKYNLGTIH